MITPSADMFGLEEASPVSSVEAMECGQPVIAPNMGGLRDIIIHESNGILIREGIADDILPYVRLFLTDRSFYDRISPRARQYAVADHSHDIQTDRYADMINSLRADVS